MERRGDNELTDDELATIEAETRALLARWGEPQLVAPPADLSARIARQLLTTPSRRHRKWRHLWLAVPLGLLALGIWGLGFDSNGPATLFGDPTTGFGRYVLTLILIAKPLWHLLLAGAWWWAAGFVALIVIWWLWWRLISDAPLARVW
ncbi:hypothetical protein [Chloroflexus sp.]|uniref:hypothetical protein n=1 Tax=Chloroflexus sp. TaxID=1904827 RepID=UPI00262E4327|nr:hypothetical protein [uncultured Chloroflexus sp.]